MDWRNSFTREIQKEGVEIVVERVDGSNDEYQLFVLKSPMTVNQLKEEISRRGGVGVWQATIRMAGGRYHLKKTFYLGVERPRRLKA
jgi:hypothetical protein